MRAMLCQSLFNVPFSIQRKLQIPWRKWVRASPEVFLKACRHNYKYQQTHSRKHTTAQKNGNTLWFLPLNQGMGGSQHSLSHSWSSWMLNFPRSPFLHPGGFAVGSRRSGWPSDAVWMGEEMLQGLPDSPEYYINGLSDLIKLEDTRVCVRLQ